MPAAHAAADLSGTWRAAPADEGLRRRYAEDGFDDGGWEAVAVPGHWRSVPAFAATDGPLLYRTPFEAPAPDGGERAWLVLDGVFYTSDVWLDGSYVGDTEGYFFPHAFEVTEALAGRADHVLALEVACPRPEDRTRKRNLTGAFQHSPLIDPAWNPGGIWRPVRLERTGPVRIRHLRVLCRDAQEGSATVFVRAVLDTAEARTVELRTTVTAPDGRELLELSRDQPLAAGENRLEWAVAVPEPELWWPWALGAQPRYGLGVEVATEAGPSHRRERPVGLRRVELSRWVCRVNGERLFLKGASLGPTRRALGEASAEEVAADVDRARQAGLDLVRVHGHIARPELYEAADRAGVLVWQDLPLHRGYARSVRAQARRQAREAVDLLAHHPSVAVWCGHDLPLATDVRPEQLGSRARRWRAGARATVAQLLPSWNKTVLDRSITGVLERADGSRPVVPHSGIIPHPPLSTGTDSHLYPGWAWGRADQLATVVRWWPRLGRFVSELGAQAVPGDAGFLDPGRWPDLDWDAAARDHGMERARFERRVPPAGHESFESWRDATQAYQAELVRRQVEVLRRLKYRPCGGFAQFCLADSQPAVSWSLLDHERRPKAGWAALAEACRPVIVVADGVGGAVAGQRLVVDVHAVSDRRISSSDMVASVDLLWRQEHGDELARLRRRWAGELPADACVRIGSIDTEVPATARRLTVALELRDGTGAVVATNRYDAGVG